MPCVNDEPLIRNETTMHYRPLGRTGLQVSALSFGCMRLSEDMALNEKLISKAIDLGVNYFETTRYYLDGQCQHRAAPGLRGRAGAVIVSGKEKVGAENTERVFREEIERQLKILGLSRFRFFQVGWLSWDKMPHLLKRGGVFDAIRKAQDEGLIRHVGFTGHDKPENFIRCIETGLFDSITVPYNLINRSYEPTIKRAGQLGVGVVAMCSLAGGILATPSPALREAIGTGVPSSAMALRFILSNPDISTACSGMATMRDLEENVRAVGGFDPASASFDGMCAGLDRLRKALGDKFCTRCRYCMPCAEGVDIPEHMHIYTLWKCYGLADWARKALRDMPPDKSASRCTECGKCEGKCPNELKIRETLKDLASGLGAEKA